MRFQMLAGVGCLVLSGILSGRTAEGAPADCFRRLADDVCTVTSVVTDGNLKVEFVLRPEKGSNIRCRMELPPAGRWDGRMWGVGNSGTAGIFLPISQFAEAGSAVVTTDLGTRDYLDEGQDVLRVWPDCVRRDYDWRATHLMTVYAKRFVEAYYGRPAAKCYFNGGSCGGRQGIGEAIRFPEDYDGVIAHLTGNNPICNEIDDFAIWKHTHDADGKLLFTERDMHVVSDAAVQYRADREERPYAGKILGDPFLSEADVEGFLALAVKTEPRLGSGDLLERLRRIFLGVVHKGRRMTYGKIPGSYLGREMQETVHAYIPQFLMSRGMEKKDMTWDDLDEFVRIYAPSYNACSDDLDAFRRRGGKLIVTVGLEDQTDPPYAPLAHFERVVGRMGGDLAATMEFYRVFAVPGCAHGGGKGRAMTKSPDGPALWRQLTDWREHGRAPERYVTNWKSEGLELPVAPYPKRLVQDEKGAWIERTFDRRMIRSVDPYYLQCDTAPFGACAEDRPLFRAGLLSDTHIRNDAGSWVLVQKAMRLFEREGVSVICHLGDLAGDYAEEGYAGYRQALETAFGAKRPLTLYAYGGHDARRFVPKKGEATGHEGAWANMRRILGIPHGMSGIVEHEGHSFVIVQEYFKDEAEVEALAGEAIRRHPGRPVFLLEHEPAFDTCENSLAWGNARIRSVCDRHPEVVHLSGHSHGSNRDELQIWQGTFTEVNVGCLQYWGGRTENAAGMERAMDDDGVLVMEVFSDRIVFRRFSLTTGLEYRPERPWRVPWPHDPARAPYRPEARKAASRAPVWPHGAALSVAWLPTGAAQLSVPVASHRDEPYRYTAEVRLPDGTRRTQVTQLGEFWKPEAAKRGAKVVFALSPGYFSSGERVCLRVTAFDFYGNASRPLEASVTVPADRPSCPVVWRCGDPKREIRYFNCGWSAMRDERQLGRDGFLDVRTDMLAVTFPEGMVPADDPAGTRYRLVFTLDDRHERYGSWLVVVRNAKTFAPLRAQGCRTAEGAAGPVTYALEMTKESAGSLPVLLWLSYGRPNTRLAVTDARLERLESKKE